MGNKSGDKPDDEQEIGLAAALGAIRRELATAMETAEAEASPVSLEVSDLELEVQTTVSRTGQGELGIRVSVISAGMGGSTSRDEVQTLRIRLNARTDRDEAHTNHDKTVNVNAELSQPPR